MGENSAPAVDYGREAGHLHDVTVPQAGVQEACGEYGISHSIGGVDVIFAPFRDDMVIETFLFVERILRVKGIGMMPETQIPLVIGDLDLVLKSESYQMGTDAVDIVGQSAAGKLHQRLIRRESDTVFGQGPVTVNG